MKTGTTIYNKPQMLLFSKLNSQGLFPISIQFINYFNPLRLLRKGN